MFTQLSCDLLLWMPLVLCLGAWRPSIDALWLTMPLNMGMVAAALCVRWRSGRWRAHGVTWRGNPGLCRAARPGARQFDIIPAWVLTSTEAPVCL